MGGARAWWARVFVGLSLLASAGCGGGGSAHGDAGTSITWSNTVLETPNRQADILFMVDDSSSMEPSQATLIASIPAFFTALEGLPGGLPDLHIAVVTSDMGAGDGTITGCSGNGDDGVFRYAPTGSCTATTLQNGATYISDTGGSAPVTNFTAPDIATVLQCLVQVGANGCGFEQQLASVARALGTDGSSPPQENVGFLRPNAYLAIVLVTNEDDCSAPVTDVLFDTNVNTNLASQVGPPGNFRCNEFGHRCSLNGGAPAPPLRLSPNPADLTTTVTYDNCVSAEEAGRLTPVASFVNGIKSLKVSPANQIVVASIQGPATPYVEHWTAAPINDTGPWPSILHSCEGTNVGFGDPGVRTKQFANAFVGNDVVGEVCLASFAPALQAVAAQLGQLMGGSSCLATGPIRNKPGTSNPDCVVTEIVPNGQGGVTQTIIPACAGTTTAMPCWELLTPTPPQCPNGHQLNIRRTDAAPANARLEIQCSVCGPGNGDAGCS
jgi:hypothetical protein